MEDSFTMKAEGKDPLICCSSCMASDLVRKSPTVTLKKGLVYVRYAATPGYIPLKRLSAASEAPLEFCLLSLNILTL